MIEIIPAILPKSFEDLREKVALISGLVSEFQIDVCDGIFVPNKTWPYIKKPDPDFEEILAEKHGFPYWEEMDFEADLMVSNPETVVPEWLSAGARRLIVHLESLKDPKATLDKIRQILPTTDPVIATEIGVAINPDTSNDDLESVMSLVDFVQFMGIAKIGFQGQPFDERVLDKIASLRDSYPDVTISVDGAVSLETAPRLIEAGANRLVVGSAIFDAADPAAALEEFLDLANQYDSNSTSELED